MDLEFERNWRALIKEVSAPFGEMLDLESLLFLIGLQELGTGFRKFKKDEKIDLLHVAICTVLEPFGYYRYLGRDEDGWPHFAFQEKLPHLETKQQQRLIKEGIMQYFADNSISAR